MRPNQQNNKPQQQRPRGRSHSNNNNNNNNNGRRGGGNPLSRNYESNGPDIKIRGNAAHIAEKYVQLARDATAIGDSVMAENYFQHAEHYFRIILAAQANYQPRNDLNNDQNSDQSDDDYGNVGNDSGNYGDQPSAEMQTTQPAMYVAPETTGSQPSLQEGENPRRHQRPRRQPRRTYEASSESAEGSAQPVVQTYAPVASEAPVMQQPVVLHTETVQAEVASAPVEASSSEDEAPKRVRRPRRAPLKKPAGDLADAPQPEIGNMPAFLSGNEEAAD